MNTSALKRFAQQARRKLLTQVGARLELVFNTDSAELREKASQLRMLREEINRSSKALVIEKVAYTWFNRLMALRFMDANDCQPLGIRVVTPHDGHTLPEILQEAKQGHISDDLPAKKQHIFDLLDGRILATNAQNEAFKELLIGACNHLNKGFPFLFERIDDYTELLLPDDLTSEFSVIHDVVHGMTESDCFEVECIGWIYQFYISEKKDEVFASNSKVKKEDIPAATQLFTPRWIVEYMVQNTVGKIWMQNHPHSGLKQYMPYYIESEATLGKDFLKINSPEELTLLDQACGSGHILVYGFELMYRIYEEQGYNPSEIPALIIKNNLFGFEIDSRAAQLAGLAVLMKAREYSSRLFRKAEIPVPHILCYEDHNMGSDQIREVFAKCGIKLNDRLHSDLNMMSQATNLGSLIAPKSTPDELKSILEQLNHKESTADLFLRNQLNQLQNAISQLMPLAKKYCCVVDNPPYMGGGNMNTELANFVKNNYPFSKADLMACFMEAGLNATTKNGMLGMINQHSWMFLSSYEDLRKKLIDTIQFDTLLHLGPRTFPEIGGEVVQNASFTFIKHEPKTQSTYVRLIDFGSSELKRTKTLEAIQNPNCGWYYTANQKDFEKIPGSPLGFWISKYTIKIFGNHNALSKEIPTRQGMATGNNEQFLRLWHEVQLKLTDFGCIDINHRKKNKKWYPYNKGGAFVKWYGNQQLLILFDDSNIEILARQGNHCPSKDKYFKKAITWTLLVGNTFGGRIVDNHIFDVNGMCAFPPEDKLLYLLGLFNSKISYSFLSIINPTLAFQKGNIDKIPFIFSNQIGNEKIISCIDITSESFNRMDWSWDFNQNELLKHKAHDLQETYDLYQQYWKNKFFQLHKNEEELNRQFIDIYGLQDELTPDVPLEDITILKEETSIVNGQLVFDAREVMAQFVSYAVGCMFGRYSLDKEGLILANQGETLEDFLARTERSRSETAFLPDEDNIIPVLDEEWFEDDIVNRFLDFLKATFGRANFAKNLDFLEKSLDKDIRRYFLKDFYPDHIRRYKKRPIYWMFSSSQGSFNVLIYLHRYTPDTINIILNKYLRQFQEKLHNQIEHLDHLIITGSASEQNRASREKDHLNTILLELQEYERNIIYPLATERIPIDLDDGVLVNYNKFGKAVKEVAGLNDKATKKKVREFDWIDVSGIR
ncbi:MAG: BREX-1 system adenine-specific DNA-methyltransferase PglX [Bacteroidales bacterium]|nr:BREX-1 system adenine-specific DNA-methyltransferase PglX [Bacteroidales bacterium]